MVRKTKITTSNNRKIDFSRKKMFSHMIPKGGGGSPTTTIFLVLGAAVLGFINGQWRKEAQMEKNKVEIKRKDDGYFIYTLRPPSIEPSTYPNNDDK